MNQMHSGDLDWRVRVFDSLSFPTLIMKPDKTIVSANRVFLQKYGMSMEQILCKTCYQVFYNSDSCPETSCPFTRVLMEKTGHTITRRTLTRTQKQLWEDRVFSPILDESGEIAYIMESVRDITRLKTLEKALKETTEFLEAHPEFANGDRRRGSVRPYPPDEPCSRRAVRILGRAGC